MENLFDGYALSYVSIPADKSKFRLTIQSTTYYFGGGYLNIYQDFVSGGQKGYNYIIERSSDKTSWTTLKSGTVANNQYQVYVAALTHSAERYHRITIDFGNINSVQTLKWIRGLTGYPGKGAEYGLPLRAAYDKTIVMQGALTVEGSGNSSFAGNVGIGLTSPGTLLHLAAATASNASLRIDAGTLLTSPISGTIEYDGTNLYFTDSGGVRRQLAVV